MYTKNYRNFAAIIAFILVLVFIFQFDVIVGLSENNVVLFTILLANVLLTYVGWNQSIERINNVRRGNFVYDRFEEKINKIEEFYKIVREVTTIFGVVLKFRNDALIAEDEEIKEDAVKRLLDISSDLKEITLKHFSQLLIEAAVSAGVIDEKGESMKILNKIGKKTLETYEGLENPEIKDEELRNQINEINNEMILGTIRLEELIKNEKD